MACPTLPSAIATKALRDKRIGSRPELGVRLLWPEGKGPIHIRWCSAMVVEKAMASLHGPETRELVLQAVADPGPV